MPNLLDESELFSDFLCLITHFRIYLPSSCYIKICVAI